MSGRPHITIAESVEVLLEIRKQQKRILAYNKVQMLYLFQSKKVKTVRELSSVLGKSETTIHRWLFQYKEGGIENLLKNRQIFGRPKKFSVEVAAALQQELREPEGFSSYKEVHLWLWLIKEIPSSYQAVYSLVKEELKSKLKIPRPRSSEQKPTAINEFKNSLSQKIKALLDQAPDQVKKYKKFLFWCSDETRLGLHTIQRRRITLRGVKPVGKHQWKFKCFWLYGAVSPSSGRSFFWEFSHLDKVCFQAYLQQLSLQYPDELHIIQVDNAPGHLLSTSELPDNIILLFQPPHCPEVNPTERVWEYIKEFLAWLVFSNLDELRVKVQEILSSLTNNVIGFLTGWSWILHSLSLAHLYKNGITIDAMGCQKEITSLISKKKGDYIIALKGNQKLLHQDVINWFKVARKEDFRCRKYSYYQQVESGHHRIEKRQIGTVDVSELPPLHNQSLWAGLTTIVMVASERRLWNKTTTEVRFYLSSLDSNAEKIALAIRSHWGIENSLHWTLDVTFSEDKSRIRKDHSPENFALLRRLAVNLLKREKTFKRSLKMKRYLAGMDHNYLAQILEAAS